jgi:hypothetical protein
MPSYVIGRNALATSTSQLQKGSNNVVLSLVTGNIHTDPQLATVVDVRDVARVEVEALKVELGEQYRSFIVDVGKVELNDVVGVAEREFEGAFERGWLRQGSTNSVSQDFDLRETEEVFGGLKGYGEMVRSVVEQYVELKENGL